MHPLDEALVAERMQIPDHAAQCAPLGVGRAPIALEMLLEVDEGDGLGGERGAHALENERVDALRAVVRAREARSNAGGQREQR